MTPQIVSLTPSSGPEAGFNSVVIAGSGFANVGPLTVVFGTTATTFTIDSDTQITAIVPPGTGTVDVTVTALLDGTSNPMPYTYDTPAQGLIYVSDGIDTVYSIPAAGGTATPVVTGLNRPMGIARVENTLYIAEFAANRVVSVPTTGGAVTPLVPPNGGQEARLAASGLSGPTDVKVSGRRLYITDSGNLRVVSAPISGGNPTLVAGGLTGASGIAV
ncbi:IPT/TIG domain-containing protein [Nocardia sp. CA-119907]|uniref:IPT/TIG domain-containing protein n=1 Tax=Nocardia sp. CA-119907 TaxID=3239973 RepID=UPI003D975FB6